MAAEDKPQMDPAVYDELYPRFFGGEGTGFVRHFSGDIVASRRTDIEDSYGTYATKIDALFPGIDDDTRRRVLAVSVFFERLGCESGMLLQGNRNHGADSDAAFRQRVTEGFGSY